MKKSIHQNKINMVREKLEYEIEQKYIKRLERIEEQIKELQQYRNQLMKRYGSKEN